LQTIAFYRILSHLRKIFFEAAKIHRFPHVFHSFSARNSFDFAPGFLLLYSIFFGPFQLKKKANSPPLQNPRRFARKWGAVF